MSSISIVNLSVTGGLSLTERRTAAKWMAQAFANAPATPALTIFFNAAPHSTNQALHESFWSSHLHTVSRTGLLLGALDTRTNTYLGFRCLFPPSAPAPSQSATAGPPTKPTMSHYEHSDTNTNADPDWSEFLKLTGEERYRARVGEWRELTRATEREVGVEIGGMWTTSIVVVDPKAQRRGVGRMLDDATAEMVREGGGRLFVRIHEYILPFYESQGYKVLASPMYTIQGSEPFKVHFLLKDVR